jgi:hypothetical protein
MILFGILSTSKPFHFSTQPVYSSLVHTLLSI